MRVGIGAKGLPRYFLNKQEKRLIRTISNAKEPFGSISDMCKTAKVKPQVYYRLIESEEHANLLAEACSSLIKSEILPVIKIVLQRAHQGSAKHAEIALRLSGLLTNTVSETKILNIFNQGAEEPLLGSDGIRRLIGWNG